MMNEESYLLNPEKNHHEHSHRDDHISSSKVAKAKNKLLIATVLCTIFMLIELIGGYIAGSLAIMTDAAHLLSDVAGFLISLFALMVSEYAPTKELSFGFHRAEVLGALLSVVFIWFLTLGLVYQAVFRTRAILNHTLGEPINGEVMVVISGIGLLFNLVLLKIFHQGDHAHGHSHGLPGSEHSHTHGHGHGEGKSLNISAAYAHALGDLLQSIGVFLAGFMIWTHPADKYPHVQLFDPFATFLFSVFVLNSTKGVFKESVSILMQTVPRNLDAAEIYQGIFNLPGVVGVHHLHIWCLTPEKEHISLSVHVQVEDEKNMNTVLKIVQHYLREKGLTHNTIQLEVLEEKVCNVKICKSASEETLEVPMCDKYAEDCLASDNRCHKYASEDSIESKV
eukprot:maker-scaffold_49-snap-gene-1.94-mRNA-1 protein AED:0.02 eAED:0.02 QI:24/1/1/1/1/1/2/331/394